MFAFARFVTNVSVIEQQNLQNVCLAKTWICTVLQSDQTLCWLREECIESLPTQQAPSEDSDQPAHADVQADLSLR